MKVRFVLVMGVSGSGKTSVSRLLANELGWDFYDADDYHPPENTLKMTNGVPLTDSDRVPWLAALHELISTCLKADRRGVLACSALKERYRQELFGDNDDMLLVYLKGSYDLIGSRMSARREHYMKADLLKSQFETLEEPTGALTLDISIPVDDIVQEIVKHLE